MTHGRPPADDGKLIAAIIAKIERNWTLPKALAWFSETDKHRLRRKLKRRMTDKSLHKRREPAES